MSQYHWMQNTLVKNESFITQYNNVLTEYINLSHMTKTQPVEIMRNKKGS